MKSLTIEIVPQPLRTDTEALKTPSLYTATNQPLMTQDKDKCSALFKRVKYLRKRPLTEIGQEKLFRPMAKEQVLYLQKVFEALYLLEDQLAIVPGIPPQGLPSKAISSSIKMSSMMSRRAVLKPTPTLIAI